MTRLLRSALAAITLAAATPSLAQAPTQTESLFLATVPACEAMVVTGGGRLAGQPAITKAGLVATTAPSADYAERFFGGATGVDWWGRSVAGSLVLLGYDADEQRCRVFLFGAAGGA